VSRFIPVRSLRRTLTTAGGKSEVDIIDNIVSRIRSENRTTEHIVAFSGGVDSSLALALTQMAHPASTRAVIGLSAALPTAQLKLAREVSEKIGVPLIEVETSEGESDEYVANAGMACYHCKTALYTALSSVVNHVESTSPSGSLTLYNGTNLDDLSDPTRVGLLAAANFNVYSPLSELPKTDVRRLAKHLSLPNHNHAASPCLRSRLAFGVEATADHLRKIERGEDFIRSTLSLPVEVDMRLRMLAGKKAMIELGDLRGANIIDESKEKLRQAGIDNVLLDELQFKSWDLRKFKSGSEAKVVEIKL